VHWPPQWESGDLVLNDPLFLDKIGRVRNFENQQIYENLPDIVDYIQDRVVEYEDEYEADREDLSSGRDPVSKKMYVKIRAKEDVLNELNFFRNNSDSMFEALEEEKVMKLDAMLRYRRLPKNLRNEAALLFKMETDRDADLQYSESQLRELIPDYEELNEEDRAYFINEQKLDDLYFLEALAQTLERD